MSETCKTCRWWEQENRTSASLKGSLDLGRCAHAVMLWDATDWETDDDGWQVNRVLLPRYADRMMFTQDGSDYCATLFTRAEHFCAAHQPRSKDDE